MYTICTNPECRQQYKIKKEMIGSRARCKKCNTIFLVEEYKRPAALKFEAAENGEENNVGNTGRRRRSSREIIEEHMEEIKERVEEIMPLLNDALQKKANESDTRLIIDKMIQKIMGYDLSEIKTEQKIEGRKADYVLSLGDTDVLIIEAKKIGMNLNERQIFQATSYGAQAGIKWVVLTNAVVWQLYHISTGERMEADLVFSIELRDGLDDDEAYYFYLLSKNGMSRKNLLNNLWKKISTLCPDNIIAAILSEPVITRIRTTITKQSGFSNIDNDEIRAVIEDNFFQLS